MPGAKRPVPADGGRARLRAAGGDGWQYEPKWDGFRGVLENDGGELALWTRNGRPLLRYFPELRAARRAAAAPLGARRRDRDRARRRARVRPDADAAPSGRVAGSSKLAAEMPAEFVAFDVLLWDGEPVWQLPLEERRARVEALDGLPALAGDARRGAARDWLARSRRPGSTASSRSGSARRTCPARARAVVKVKEHKTADCVVVGVRWKEQPTRLATLLLGLYRDDGGLDYVGSAAVGARAARRDPRARRAAARGRARARLLGAEPLGRRRARRVGAAARARRRGAYDKVQGNRFRHGTKLLRFRPDKEPEQCTWREVRPPRAPGRPDVRVAARRAVVARRAPGRTRATDRPELRIRQPSRPWAHSQKHIPITSAIRTMPERRRGQVEALPVLVAAVAAQPADRLAAAADREQAERRDDRERDQPLLQVAARQNATSAQPASATENTAGASVDSA